MDDVHALRALALILGDEPLRGRFLALTGYDPETLRARAGTPDMAAAVENFLAGNEADLVRVASALEIPPERLLAR